MLIDASLTIAYKCSSCGTFEFFNISLFKIRQAKKHVFNCRCGMSSITLIRESEEEYMIAIPCIGCGGQHIFIASEKMLFFKDVNILYCPEKGMHQCIFGKDDTVRQKVDNIEKEMDELISKFGYDDYFCNTQVMIDTLNRIHDIAEQGNLDCECGNTDIELILLSDRIQLKCRKCSSIKVIFASTNRDLKDILTRQHIRLSGEYIIHEDSEKIYSFLFKMDGK